jgi:hypothetical protein
MKKTIVMLSVAVLLLTGQVFAVVITADSATWEGSYEGDVKPGSDGFTGSSAASASCHPGAPATDPGILWVSSVDNNTSPYWTKTTPPVLDLTTGDSFEVRLKMLQAQNSANWATCMFIIQTQAAGGAATKSYTLAITDTQIRLQTVGGSTRYITMDTTDAFHTYRVTYSSAGFGLFLDDNPSQVTGGGVSSDVSGNPGPLMQFGDFTGTDDSEYLLDYIRWTNADAFPAPEPATMGLLLVGGVLGVIRKRK